LRYEKEIEQIFNKHFSSFFLSFCIYYDLRQVSTEEGQACANALGCAFIECSAKHNENVEEAFRLLIEEIEKASSMGTEEKNTCHIL
jgi:hypothetical protein